MDVTYDTTFEKIEDLRARMIAFLESRRRDFSPTFDVVVQDLPGQEKMVLQASIKYKSNGHMGALRGPCESSGAKAFSDGILYSQAEEHVDLCAQERHDGRRYLRPQG